MWAEESDEREIIRKMIRVQVLKYIDSLKDMNFFNMLPPIKIQCPYSFLTKKFIGV